MVSPKKPGRPESLVNRETRSGNRVIPTPAEGMTAQQTTNGEKDAAPGAMAFDGLDGVG